MPLDTDFFLDDEHKRPYRKNYREKSRKYIDPSTQPMSRYRRLARITYADGTEIVESPNQVYIDHEIDTQWFRVTEEYANRLDKVSYKFYNTVKLWWVIAYASNILDPYNVPAGTRLRIPPFTTAISDGII